MQGLAGQQGVDLKHETRVNIGHVELDTCTYWELGITATAEQEQAGGELQKVLHPGTRVHISGVTCQETSLYYLHSDGFSNRLRSLVLGVVCFIFLSIHYYDTILR